MLCGVCNKHIKGKTSGEGDVISCSKCPKKIHQSCLKLTRDENKAIRANEYACQNCKMIKPLQRKEATPVRTCSQTSPTNSSNEQNECAATNFLTSAQNLAALPVPSEVLSSFTTALRQLQQVFDTMKRDMNDFTTSLNYTTEDIATFRTEITEIKGQLKELDIYKNEVKNLRAEVVELRQELDAREQRRLLKDIEITGLTENNGENVQQLVTTICNTLGVQLDPRDIDDVRRVGQRGGGAGGPERPRPVVVTMIRRAPRDQILRAAKVRRGLTTDKLEIAGNPRRVFINEHLTKGNRILFSKARAIGALHKFKFVWTSNGSIFMRRTETSSVLRVSSEAVLDKLAGEPDNRSQPGPVPFQVREN